MSVFLRKLTPTTPTPDDARFGWRVATWGDLLVTGALTEANFAGAVYVFETTSWSQVARLTGDNIPGTGFGVSVSVWDDTILVGQVGGGFAPGNGSVFVFARNSVEYIFTARLTASDGASGDLFGADTALYENWAVIGAPHHGALRAGAAYLFRRDGNEWTQVRKLTTQGQDRHFGFEVSMDASFIAVGANDFDNLSIETNAFGTGAVFVYSRAGDHLVTLQPSDLDFGDEFSTGLTLRDGLLVAGAPRHGAGAAYVYNTSWDLVTKLNASGTFFGRSSAVKDDVVLVGSNLFGIPQGDPGRAEIFSRDDWSSFATFDTTSQNDFGTFVGLGEKGLIFISAMDDVNGFGIRSGSIYVYQVQAEPLLIESSSKKSKDHDNILFIVLGLVLLFAFFVVWRCRRNKHRLVATSKAQTKEPTSDVEMTPTTDDDDRSIKTRDEDAQFIY